MTEEKPKKYLSVDDLMAEIDARMATRPWYNKVWSWMRRWHPIYWLRCHTWTRYHLVDCRNKWYEWGWCDVDSRILYSCFELLRQFIEGENGLEHLAYQGPAIRADENMGTPEEREFHAKERDRVYEEVKALWKWWTEDRVPPWEAETLDEETDLYMRDTEMLTRLMQIRGSLWT